MKHKLIRGWCCALMMALATFLMGPHPSASAAMAQTGDQESGLSASTYHSHHMAMARDAGAAPAEGGHASMTDGSGQNTCCAAMDQCGLSCAVMAFNGKDGVSFQPSFPPLRVPPRVAAIEGQIPPPLFRPPILFS